MHIRRLTAADAPAFQSLRLAAMLDAPDAFLSSHAEEKDMALADIEARLAGAPDRVVLGAFAGDTLLGVVGVARESRVKLAHKVHVWGMAVAADARGRGLGRALMGAALAHARGLPGVAKVTLSADAANVPAIALYESLGFVVYSREQDAVRVDGVSGDDLMMHLRLDAAAAP